jgi:predicted nucleotidyltransferase
MESAEKEIYDRAQSPDYLAITGSRLYGTSRDDSDWDYRGFFVPPFEYLTDSNRKARRDKTEVELAKPPAGDHKVYTLGTFVEGLCKGDPQMLEIMYAPKTHHVHLSEIGAELLANAHRFASKTFYWRIVGFSNSEWRKARGVKVEIPDQPKTEKDVIMMIRNVYGPDKEEMDQIITLLNKKKVYVEIPSLQGMGEKRAEEFHKYGYTASSACHSLRLMFQCRELLETGTMTFPRPESPLLREIKHGRMPLPEIIERYDEAKIKCDEAFQSSKLQEKPDREWANDWYERQVAKALVYDKRMVEAAIGTE